jgi:6-phosphofructokinase 1
MYQDCCLIPESPFYLEGEGGLYRYIEKRLKENGHMVIVVAEGAGQKLIAENMKAMGQDASGNALLLDVGLWLSQKINVRLLKLFLYLPFVYIITFDILHLRLISKSDDTICTVCIMKCLIENCDRSAF